jgi:hypothetical protein
MVDVHGNDSTAGTARQPTMVRAEALLMLSERSVIFSSFEGCSIWQR